MHPGLASSLPCSPHHFPVSPGSISIIKYLLLENLTQDSKRRPTPWMGFLDTPQLFTPAGSKIESSSHLPPSHGAVSTAQAPNLLIIRLLSPASSTTGPSQSDYFGSQNDFPDDFYLLACPTTAQSWPSSLALLPHLDRSNPCPILQSESFQKHLLISLFSCLNPRFSG